MSSDLRLISVGNGGSREVAVVLWLAATPGGHGRTVELSSKDALQLIESMAAILKGFA
jgi:hypothetical protein